MGKAAVPLGKALDQARMSRLHRRFWLLAGLGILLDGFDFFIIGVASPLIQEDFGINAWQKGLVSSAAILGAMVGAAVLGPLGDKLGRARIFKYDLVMFVVFSVGCMLAPEIWSLIAFRFLLGIAIGLDYPIAASYLAEIFLVLGFLAAIFTVERLGRVRLQSIGFVFMTLGMLILAVTTILQGPDGEGSFLGMVFLGYAIFNFFQNAGPNATTPRAMASPRVPRSRGLPSASSSSRSCSMHGGSHLSCS